MDADFWHQRWQRGEIAFHEGRANPLLVAHFGVLRLTPGARLFLPLCGKTRDIGWLLERGFRIVGAELSELAIEALFEELGLEPEINAAGTSIRYRARHIDVFVGDVFELSSDLLGRVDAVYDRAALVAMPAGTRAAYAAHITLLSAAAPQLLISYEYDQSKMPGPPFSVDTEELLRLYGATYDLRLVECTPVENGLKGQVAATQSMWLFQPDSDLTS